MQKPQPKKEVRSMSRFARASRRARGTLVLAVCIAIVGFICLPLLYNGILFSSPVQEEVYAATLKPSAEAPPQPPVEEAPHKPDASVEILPPDSNKASEPQLIAEYIALKLGDDLKIITTLQERLMELGFFENDMLTTYYGTATEHAVMLFQRAQGLEETGVADHETQALLFSGEALSYRMKLGDKGSDIKSMQRRLNELGYYDEKDNGYFGIATERAVKKFQERNKIEQTGMIDMEGRELLYSHKARYLVDPTPSPTPTKTPRPKATPTPTQKATNTPKQTFVIPEEAPLEKAPEKTSAPSTPKYTEPEGSYGTGVSALLAAAKAQLNKPYVYGDEGPDSFDCSGFVYYSLRQAGVKVGRYSALSYSQLTNWTAINSLDKCKAGDLLFYKSDTNPNVNHTGIYLGNGTFIHASSSKGKVIVSNCTDYYYRNFIIARRVF